MADKKLSINSGVKTIEVNDNGDYISIPMNDGAFYGRFKDFLAWLDAKQADMQKAPETAPQSATDAAEQGEDKPIDIGALSSALDTYTGLCKEICERLDALFGAGCCRKVFPGVEIPDFVLIDDFLEQITPILAEFAQERNERINLKYNSRRKGANSR